MKKNKDHDKPIGRLKIIDDFLPSPDELVQDEKTQKITILLNKRSIEFFKKQAQKNNTKYQRMIRNLLERYVKRYIA
ncbi:MAG: CopG family transcriptional regulator [bacterium]|nr:CopG family transcriptional regulator [bacterium]